MSLSLLSLLFLSLASVLWLSVLVLVSAVVVVVKRDMDVLHQEVIAAEF